MNAQALIVFDMIADEPWFTFHTDHDDGIERTDLQLALCELATYTRMSHYAGDGCLEAVDEEEALDERVAALSAASSDDERCRSSGHFFDKPYEFRDTCTRCGCVRLLRGNPGRFVYLDPNNDSAVPDR